MRKQALMAAGCASVLMMAGCGDRASSSSEIVPTSNFAELSERPDTPAQPQELSEVVTADAVWPHLEAFQEIADTHGGNRASTAPGYSASVDYVAGLLAARGFEVTTPEFTYEQFDVQNLSLRAGDTDIPVDAVRGSIGTGANEITRPLVVLQRERGGEVDATPGCEARDYIGVDASDAIVLVDRGACSFSEKERVAAAQGAAALVVANNEDGMVSAAISGDEPPRVPMVVILREDGEKLRENPSELTLNLQATYEISRSRNVVAQTATGSTQDVVVVGAHLDSVPDGPGINDNGSGVAAVLETALAMGAQPEVANAVRFVFFGAEEPGLLGSTDYVESLTEEQLLDIALMLNFDMIASPNAGFLVYDGDDSDVEGVGPGPEGSAGIERVFGDFYTGRGTVLEGTDFDGRSDYGPFIEVGIPSGGIFTGAEEVKSPAQADLWGGEADEAFDPNYHGEGDTLDNIDREALDLNSAAVAYTVATYAQTIEGPNGVPGRADRAALRTPADGN